MSEEAKKGNKKTTGPASKEQVINYLKRHPDFLMENPDLVESLKAPKTELGDGVVDLQHFMVGGLQKQLKNLQEQYEELVEFCRENMSVQSQVHGAIIRLLEARDLEQLLQVLTVDLVALFDVDVVRLAMETEGADMYEASYPEAHYSGITFIENGTADVALGEEGDILLVEDIAEYDIPGFEDIFADCAALVRSCALLRLRLETTRKDVLLSFGVRNKGRFNPQQGVDLLVFLAQIIELRLDACLTEIDPEAFV